MSDLSEAMELAKRALYAELEWLMEQDFTHDEAVTLMRLREIEENGW
jgi:hypothetical protein